MYTVQYFLVCDALLASNKSPSITLYRDSDYHKIEHK